MRVRARARQRGIELPLVISDHCRLGRPHRDHRRDRRRRDLGNARPGRRAGALVQVARSSRAGRSISSAMATRRRARPASR
jgi:hypothetical protein